MSHSDVAKEKREHRDNVKSKRERVLDNARNIEEMISEALNSSTIITSIDEDPGPILFDGNEVKLYCAKCRRHELIVFTGRFFCENCSCVIDNFQDDLTEEAIREAIDEAKSHHHGRDLCTNFKDVLHVWLEELATGLIVCIGCRECEFTHILY